MLATGVKSWVLYDLKEQLLDFDGISAQCVCLDSSYDTIMYNIHYLAVVYKQQRPALFLGQAHATAFCILVGFVGNTWALCMAGDGWEQCSGESRSCASLLWQENNPHMMKKRGKSWRT